MPTTNLQIPVLGHNFPGVIVIDGIIIGNYTTRSKVGATCTDFTLTTRKRSFKSEMFVLQIQYSLQLTYEGKALNHAIPKTLLHTLSFRVICNIN